jgi:hypothetical protein
MKRQLESFDELAVTPRTVTERLKPAHARFGTAPDAGAPLDNGRPEERIGRRDAKPKGHQLAVVGNDNR